ncbi:MAG TPA: DUF4386 domain-containing protein [Candidatus Saccharimonadales bacterium]|nr:DUF4386 domain-containing protein [Candidatus Saccharimonadales bacterium]
MKMTLEAHRKTSLIAGLLYLLTFISIPTLSLYGPTKSADFILSNSSDTGVIIGALLEVIMALACIGTAVVLYPLLKKQSQTLALGLVASRIVEATAIFIGVSLIMAIVSLHQSGAGADMQAAGHMLAVLYDRVFLQSQSFLPAVNDLLLGILLYKSRLVPRGLSLIGIIGAFPLLLGYGAVMFNVIGQHDSWAGLAALLVALFELSLGVWLVVKGFNSKAVAALK